MNAKGTGAAVVCAVMAAGCGGSGGDSTPPAPQASYVSPSVYVQGQAITPLAPTVTGTATGFSVSPALPAGLAMDAATGVISGTPGTGAPTTDYTVTVTGAGGSTTAHVHLDVEPVATVTRSAVTGTSVYPTVTLDATALGLTGTVYAKVADAGGTFGPTVTVSANGSSRVLEFTSIGSVAPGAHTGQATVSLCQDAACSTPQAVPTLLVNYSLDVRSAGGAWPGNHLTTLSAIAGAPEWATFQGNAAHTGLVPVTLDPNQFGARWQLGVPSFLYFNGLFNLATVTTAGGNFYIAGNNAVTAHSEYDGSTLWSYSFAGLPFPSVNPPAVSNGTVYVAAGQQSSTYMFGLDASNGSVKFRSAMSSQWEDYLAPTVGPSGVYTNAGGYGGVYGFDPQGTQLFFGGTAQQSAWTPAVDASGVYAYTGDALHVFDPVTGAVRASIADPTFTNYIYEIGGSAVLGAPNSVFAAAYGNSWLNGGGIGNALVHFNLTSNSVDWSVHGVYPSTPAYDGAVVYVANNNPLRVEARAEADGSLIWSWTPPAAGDTKFLSEVLLT
ncbi:MAG TPA: putative Ig domain-containing protein, partial [Burkholderiaceae bacterium]